MNAMTNDASELAAFTAFPLPDLMPALGFEENHIEKRHRGKSTTIWTKGSTTLWVYPGATSWMWKNYDDGKSGSVIHLARECVDGGNFGKARQLLRNLTNTPVSALPPSAISSPTNPPPTPIPAAMHVKVYRDPALVRTEYLTGSEPWHPSQMVPDYLFDREILVIKPCHARSFRVAHDRGTIRFPYYSMPDDLKPLIVGMEEKNHKFQRYTTEGEAGMWCSGSPFAEKAVICEAPIDCLTYDSTSADDNFLIAMRAGSEHYVIKFLRARANAGLIGEVIICTDMDAAGMLYAHKIMQGLCVGPDKIPGLIVRYLAPEHGKNDQNDALRESLRIDEAMHGGQLRDSLDDARRAIARQASGDTGAQSHDAPGM